ncbi:tRNA (guanine-N(7)-)-methyltransferase [Planctomycetales bacterium 10988]|nr:tRNA (guanine-N(7)-)-methyltransferase [Planctomycetales bacterium 10988]
MGRRAAPRMDPRIEYDDYLKSEDELNPWQPEVWFGRQAPLEIEVGTGKGLFLRNFSPRQPETNFLGMEIAARYARYAAYRAAKHSMENVRIYSGDALRIFREVIPDACVAGVHVYFPDPWWKARHHKRRVLQRPFLLDILRVLEPGGLFHFWTDVEPYFKNTLDLMKEIEAFDGPHEVPEREPEHPLDYRTHRERRVRLEGGMIYRSLYKKPVD